MASDVIDTEKLNEDIYNFCCISSREYLPREKCSIKSWNNDIRIKIQYEFTNLLPILFISKNKDLIAKSQLKLQKIIFELLIGVLYYTDILSVTAVEFLENCSIVSYLKVCKILGYDFVGKEELDIQEIPTDCIKDEFKNFILNPENANEEKLPSFKIFVENYMTPLIMDTIWLLQMGYNDSHTDKNHIWLEFITRLCRGNITSKERPLPSIPKSVKLINVKDVVSFLDLGKTDNMGITESLISPKYKLQQKYVRERTRICFTVDSFTTQKECLKGFSILAITIKSFFDKLFSFPDLSYEELFPKYTNNFFDRNNYKNNNSKSENDTSHNFEIKLQKCEFNFNNVNLLWNIIVRYDLSIQRTIGIIFEVFIVSISNIYKNKEEMYALSDNKAIKLLEDLLALFPKKMVTKSYLVFIEYITDIYKSCKNDFIKTEDKSEINIGGDKYKNIPWLIINKEGLRSCLDFPFFLLASFLIKKNILEFGPHFKTKLIEWDNMYWSDYNSIENDSQELKNDSICGKDHTCKYIPCITLSNIKKIYQYYHILFNYQINNNQFERDLELESILKKMLKFKGINIDEINYTNISIIISTLLEFPSILFVNAYFVDMFFEKCTLDKNPEMSYVSIISKNFQGLHEITEFTSMPFAMMNLSSNILKFKLKKMFFSFKSNIRQDREDSNMLELYKSFHLLINWIQSYCKYYFFKKFPEFIPILLEIFEFFIRENNLLNSLFEGNEFKLSNFKSPMSLLYDILSDIIFPAISLLPKSPIIPEMLKNSIFNHITLFHRYQIYRRLITVSYNKYPMNYQWLSVKKSLSKYLKAVTKDILTNKNDSRNSNGTLRRPAISTRLLISNIINLCYTNPMVVCDSIINQCNIYDNMIPLLIEILGNNIDDICFDMMIFIIINFIFSRNISNMDSRSKNKDLNGSKLGPREIAKFTALLFTRRKVPKDILTNFLKTIMYRVDETFNATDYTKNIQNSFLDIIFWKQLLEIVLSTPVLDLSVLTEKQIKCLGGGPLLFQLLLSQHESNSSEMSIEQPYFSLLLDASSPVKQTNEVFVSILQKNDILSKEILFRMAKLRTEILWDTPSNGNVDIKLLVNLSDEIHWCCIQTIEFLKRSFDSQTYRTSVLNLSAEKMNFEEIISQTFFYLDIPIAWSFLRFGIRDSQLNYSVNANFELLKDSLFDVDNQILNCLRSYLLKENENQCFYSEKVWLDFYILFWYLDLEDIVVPCEEYSVKLFELYNDIYDCKENIDKIIIQQTNEVKIDNKLERLKLDSFLDAQSIKTIPNYIKTKNFISRQARDTLKLHEKKFKKLHNFYTLLSEEFRKCSQRTNFINKFFDSTDLMNKFKEQFSKFSNESLNLEFKNKNNNFINSFIYWICRDLIAPRVIQSEKDAIFSYKWIEKVLFDPKNGLFSLNKKLIESFLVVLCKLISSLIRSSTPRESQLLGLFFNLIFSYIKQAHLHENQEFDSSNSMEIVEELDLDLQNKKNNSDSNNKKKFSNFVYSCEKNMMISLSLGLGILRKSPLEMNPEWIDTLSSVWLLLRCYESFPITKLSGEYLLRILPNIIEYSTSKQWNDLNLSLNSLMLKLKQRRENWIDNLLEFTEEKNKKELSSSDKILNNYNKKNSTITVDDRNRGHSSHDFKRQRISINGHFRNNHSYSKPSNSNRRDDLRKR